jgi:MOSC domain-containing protein YiiM/GNAT superfamily N-acetyltransferase
MGRLVQVNISDGGLPKLAVAGARVERLGLVGDEHHNDTVHGGPLRAVCLLGTETIERLRAEGHPVVAGGVGENLTTTGIDWSTLPPGTRVRVGEQLLLELTGPATPCDLQRPNFLDGRVNRISSRLYPADSRMYARVLEPGSVRAGDVIELLPMDATSDAPLLMDMERVDAAIAAGFLALWRSARAAGHDVRILDDEELVVAASPGITSPLFNAAVSGPRSLPQLLGRVLDHFRAAGVGGWIDSDETPWAGAVESTSRAVLAAHTAAIPVPAADGPMLPAGVTIRALEADDWRPMWNVLAAPDPTTAGARLWADILPATLRTRGVVAFVAERDGIPVGTGTLVMHRKVGSLVAGGVLPEARRQGIQAALIAARIDYARREGCDLICAEADLDSTSERNLRRGGLAHLRVARVWRFDAGDEAASAITERRPATA